MRRIVERTGLALAATALLLGGCHWQMFETIEITGSPTVRIPGGTVRRAVADIEQFVELEEMLAEAFDEGTRIASDPYTYRARALPLSVDTDTLFDDSRFDETTLIREVTLTDVNISQVAPETVDIEIPAINGAASLEETVEVSGPTEPGFVEAVVGEGELIVSVENLPQGDYTLNVTVTGAEGEGEGPDPFTGDFIGAEGINASVPLAGLQIGNAAVISVDVHLSWSNVVEPASGILLNLSFSINSFSTLVLDVGPDPLQEISADPVEIAEDLRRQIARVQIDGNTSQIVMEVTADLPTAVGITLLSEALFAGGASDLQTIAARDGEVQTLTFPITATEIVFQDPSEAEEAAGLAFIEIGVQAELEGHDGDLLTLNDVSTSEPLASPLNADVRTIIEITEVSLRDIGELLEEFELALEEGDLAPIRDLPDWLSFVTIPVRFWIEGTVDVPAIDLTITAFGDEPGDEPVVTTFHAITTGEEPVEQDLAETINARPSRIEFGFGVAGGASELRLGPGDQINIGVEIDFVVDIRVIPETGDEVDVLAAFLGDDGLTSEDDVLGRDDPSDLAELFDSLSAARLVITFQENSTGMDGLRYEITHPDVGEGIWRLAGGPLGIGTEVIELDAQDIDRIRDTVPFTPSLGLFLEARQDAQSYRLNYDGALEVLVLIELETDIAHRFTMFGEGE